MVKIFLVYSNTVFQGYYTLDYKQEPHLLYHSLLTIYLNLFSFYPSQNLQFIFTILKLTLNCKLGEMEKA